MKPVHILVILTFFLILSSSDAHDRSVRPDEMLKEFFTKDSVTVLVTDSGLGGLAVCADIESRLHNEHPFASVKIIFCNALPESDYGYNMMRSTDEKVQVFSDALEGMTRTYSPDIILIACNTLSVLYEQTPFSHTATIPVVSIVSIGVELMTRALKADPSSTVIIFGTETTIDADSHRSLLIKNGIAQQRIITQACPDLAGEIQADASSDAVATMIGFYGEDALGKLPASKGPLYASLCCTHYGYADSRFRAMLDNSGRRRTSLIDPTRSMSDVIFPKKFSARFRRTASSVSVISRADITPQEVRSIATLIDAQSHATAQALASFELNKHLFEFMRK
jgi:glutamate racemase